MKQTFILLIFSQLAFSGVFQIPSVAGYIGPEANTAENLFQNPGFETGTLDSWGYPPQYPFLVSVSQMISYSGSYSAHVLLDNGYVKWGSISQNISSNPSLDSSYRVDMWTLCNCSSISLPPVYLYVRLLNATDSANPWSINLRYWFSANGIGVRNQTFGPERMVDIDYVLGNLARGSWVDAGGRYIRGDLNRALLKIGAPIHDYSKVRILEAGVGFYLHGGELYGRQELFLDDFKLWRDLTPSTLTLEHDAVADNLVTLSGSLHDGEFDFALPNEPIQLKYSHDGNPPQDIDAVQTQPDGRFSYSWNLPALFGQYDVTAVFSGSSDHSFSTAAVEFGQFYAYHLKTVGFDDRGGISREIPPITFREEASYLLEVSFFVANFQVNASRGFAHTEVMGLSLAGNQGLGLSLGVCHGYDCAGTTFAEFSFGGYGAGVLYPWSIGQWYSLSIATQNGSTSFYINGEELVSGYPDHTFSVTRVSEWGGFGGGIRGEAYATDLSVRENGVLMLSESFAQGLSAYSITESAGATVESQYLGVTAINLGSPRTLSTLLTSEVSPLITSPDREVRVAGFLSDTSGLPIAFRKITVRYSAENGLAYRTWKPVATTITGPDGEYASSFIPSFVSGLTNRYEIIATSDADSSYSSTQSSSHLVLVGPPYPAQLTLSLSTTATVVGFSVVVSGALKGGPELSPIPGADVVLEYTVPGVLRWNLITSAETMSDGSFGATWIPQATGTFSVRASWEGNASYSPSSDQAVLTTSVFEERYVFSVTSNATVSALLFDATRRTLDFKLSSASQTTAYVEVTIAKNLVESVEGVTIYVNGTQVAYTSRSLDDSWLLRFALRLESSYEVSVGLGPAPTVSSDPVAGSLPWMWTIAIAVSAGSGVVGGAVLLWRRTSRRVPPSPRRLGFLGS